MSQHPLCERNPALGLIRRLRHTKAGYLINLPAELAAAAGVAHGDYLLWTLDRDGALRAKPVDTPARAARLNPDPGAPH